MTDRNPNANAVQDNKVSIIQDTANPTQDTTNVTNDTRILDGADVKPNVPAAPRSLLGKNKNKSSDPQVSYMGPPTSSAHENPFELAAVGIPNKDQLNQDTLEADYEFFPTGNTEDISDVTGSHSGRTRTSSRLSINAKSIFVRMAAIYERSHVQYITVFNVFQMLVIIAMLIFLTTVSIQYKLQLDEWYKLYNITKPCFFEWGQWSECSATCRTGEIPPTKFRKAIQFIHAAGKLSDVKCDAERLSKVIDIAPCNVYQCPIKLSELKFGDCLYEDTNDENRTSCIRTRRVLDVARLIELDGDATLFEPCDCSTANNWISRMTPQNLSLINLH
ncbi:unnamed protein product [Bursaphelenchus okinawaensis]|uniref:Uncharacterized protein n=1 Tax=Bursaphelenchus okinawaensis TaxID=465554 RepID=A0A811JV06_9BILA|nr:unnamed protein product [Bursaphelenchus okinawaensis]CAG9085190.1 unnamed protein product [Bursaphelenchus okinawaensis]